MDASKKTEDLLLNLAVTLKWNQLMFVRFADICLSRPALYVFHCRSIWSGLSEWQMKEFVTSFLKFLNVLLDFRCGYLTCTVCHLQSLLTWNRLQKIRFTFCYIVAQALWCRIFFSDLSNLLFSSMYERMKIMTVTLYIILYFGLFCWEFLYRPGQLMWCVSRFFVLFCFVFFFYY